MQTYKTNLYLYLYLYIHMYVHEISVSCIIPNVPKVSYQTESSFPASISNFNSVSLHSLAELQFLYWCRLSVQLSPYSDAPPLSERFVWNHIMAIFPSLWTLLFQALTMSPSRSFSRRGWTNSSWAIPLRQYNWNFVWKLMRRIPGFCDTSARRLNTVKTEAFSSLETDGEQKTCVSRAFYRLYIYI